MGAGAGTLGFLSAGRALYLLNCTTPAPLLFRQVTFAFLKQTPPQEGFDGRWGQGPEGSKGHAKW